MLSILRSRYQKDMKSNIFRISTLCLFTIIWSSFCGIKAQSRTDSQHFTYQDTLRGSITPERVWWDLSFYDLSVKVDTSDSSISGTNIVQYKVLEPYQVMQLDLQSPMKISQVTQNGKPLTYKRDGNAWFITLKEKQKKGDVNAVQVTFSGKPKVAIRPPWDGGFTWTHDSNGKSFIATSNQGIGASIWWPNKDHPYDEVDSLLINVNAPGGLMDVSNGRLRGMKKEKDGTKTWSWFVSNPINSYGVNINIGDYVHFGEVYDGEKGPLDMNYYVLRENEEKAKKQFKQAKLMMEAYEYWFGPYPFYEDGYKLVEAPYLGMEHQSSVTYGNKFENGYLGRDRSSTGWGLKFDFIIIHESAHEWFANNITDKDVADMWLHEGFTTYAESLYLEYHFGKQAAHEYVLGLRPGILNDRPMIGPYGVNKGGSGDIYNKGGNLLNMIRQIAANDSLWRSTLRGLNKTFYHQTVTSAQIENYMGEKLGLDLDPVFDQYLRDTKIPTLEYAFRKGRLMYRWGNAISDFHMPVDVTLDGKKKRLDATNTWNVLKMDVNAGHLLVVNPNYYVASFNLLGN